MKVLLAFFIIYCSLSIEAQTKLSPWLRQIVKKEARLSPHTSHLSPHSSHLTTIAFVRLSSDDDDALTEHGCQSLAHFGDLHIAAIPLSQLPSMCADNRIMRIEASPCGHVLMDTTSIILNATQAYEGINLPQAYSGNGVVVGVMDIGFDLTHPNFYSADTTRYRIKRFWDMLSQDTIGSPFPVGRDYTTREELLALGHARDGLDQEHGTHTLGIAAGSGYDTNYRGMVPDADICLVANAVGEDLIYIDSADVYKYTFATDALGFKYLFDYAASVGKPCVASFSEGSQQDFYGYDQLYYAFLDSISGPGRIIVAAAGNDGTKRNYIHKPRGIESAGTFLRCGDSTMVMVMRAKDDFNLRLVAYAEPYDTLTVNLRQVVESEDSTLTCENPYYRAVFEAYPSSYDANETCLDLTIITDKDIGGKPRLSLELLGTDADVELWRINGQFNTYPVNPLLADGQNDHYIHSPSTAPCVISVGATSWRDHMMNMDGRVLAYDKGTDGRKAMFSSMGPTFDGRIKPDCVAPGNYVYSSYSSFKLEEHPDDVTMHSVLFQFNGRTYAWGASSGTSMSTPAVAGAIALWLEACPTLTTDDVKGVLERTCRHYDATLSYPNNSYGYGEVDVYAGLLDILGFSSIRDIPQQHTAARITIGGRMLHIVLPEEARTDIPLRIYDLSGRPVFNTMLSRGKQSHSLTLPSLPSAVYAVCIGNASTLVRYNER
ncbi:MAG: S8 family serine peptidase [Prevotella sp.]|nr:S8 family serine peptidase [Prevotella sp.]